MISKITIEDFYRLVNETKSQLTEHFKNISGKLESSIEVHEKFIEINKIVEILESENAKLSFKLKKAERKPKEHNVIFHGVKEGRDETSDKLTETIKDILLQH